MQYFTIDGRDGGQNGSACDTCCCEKASARPGETNQWVLNYAPWSLPIGQLVERTAFEIEKISACAIDTNAPSIPLPGLLVTPVATALAGNLVPLVTNPSGDALTFAVAQFSNTKSGTLSVLPDGSFTYTPNANFTGYDRFFYQVESDNHATIVGEVIIGVGAVVAPTSNMETPIIMVPRKSIVVNTRMHTVSFAVEVSAAAKPGDAYRLTVKQGASDCNSQCFFQISCFDITIGSCR